MSRCDDLVLQGAAYVLSEGNGWMASMPPGADPDQEACARRWTFLTNHGHVLIRLHRDPEARLRDIAADIGITERAAQAIVTELERSGYITRIKEGRRNRYEIHDDRHFGLPAEPEHPIRDLLRNLT